MEIYERIKKIGESKNKNIAQIESGAGLSKATISKWKTGSPSVDSLFAVSDYLEVDPRYILSGELKSYDLPTEHQELLNTYNKLSPNQQTNIKNILNDYKELIEHNEALIQENQNK